MFKTKLQKHPRHKDISFDKDTHTYTYKGEKEFTGVTSLISRYTKPFDRKKVSKAYGRKHGMSQADVLNLWKRDNEYGNIVHDAIEDYIINGVIDENVEHELEYFQQAMDEHELKPIGAEVVLYDEDIETASMADIVCEKNKKIVIVDTKTMKNGLKFSSYGNRKMIIPLNHLNDSNYWKYCLQISLYKHWLEKKYEFPVSNSNYIFHVRPEGYEMVKTFPLMKEVELIYEDIKEYGN